MNPTESHDLAIVGGGPAGLACALYATRYGIDAITVEKGAFGGQISTTPEVDNYPGLPEIAGRDLGEQLYEHAKSLGASILQDEVTNLSKTTDGFELECYGVTLKAKAVVYTAGAQPRMAGFAGEDSFRGRGVSYCATCDGMFYRDKDIYVVGGGNTACEEALYLSKIGKQVTMIVRKDRMRAAQSLQDKISNSDSIVVRYQTKIESIEGEMLPSKITLRSLATNEVETIECDPGSYGIFVAVGHDADAALVASLVDLASDGSIITDDSMATKTSGLFCAGDVREKPLRQVVTAVSDGAVAAQSAMRYLDSI